MRTGVLGCAMSQFRPQSAEFSQSVPRSQFPCETATEMKAFGTSFLQENKSSERCPEQKILGHPESFTQSVL